MSRNRKYVLATSWNCSNKLTGRKVMMLYLEVMMQLLWCEKKQVKGFICTTAKAEFLSFLDTMMM